MNRGKFLLAAVVMMALAIASSQSLRAQQAPAGNGVPVQMIVTVEARHGSDVPDVTQKDVMVYEGHNRDQVTDWVPARAEHAQLELFVLIDDSSGGSIGNQLDELRKFMEELPSSALVGVAYMQNGTAKVEQNLTNDHALAAKGLRLPLGMAGANASPYFSLSDLLKRWPQTKSRREVLMVTDGIDRYYGSGDLNDPYLSSAIDAAQREGVLVSAIYNPSAGHFGHSYWQAYWGQMYLAEIADRTGGEAYYIGMTGSPVSFSPYLRDLTNRTNHQYLLTFVAKAEKKGGLRSVKVRTEVSNAELVAADRVFDTAAQ